MKAAWPWIAVLGCSAWFYHSSGATWDTDLFPLFLLIVLCDVVYAIGGSHRFSRVAPAVALSGIWLGASGALVCLTALLAGTVLLLVTTSAKEARAVESAGRSLLPFAIAPLFFSGETTSFSQLLFALQAYFVVALFLPPKDARFRFDLLLLIAAPGLALALVTVARDDPRLALLMLPLLVALSCTREDNVVLVVKLRKLLGLTQSKDDQIKFLIRSSQQLLQVKDPDKLKELLTEHAAEAPRPELYELFQQQGKIALRTAKQQKDLTRALQEQAEQTKRLQGLMGAAQRMASTLDAEELERALRDSLDRLTNQKTEQKEMVEILNRIYSTCRQNVETLRELKESQARLLESNRMAAVGRLAAGVAHELNTPLGAISLSAEHGLLQIERGRAEKAKSNLENIFEAAQMSKLTIARLRAYTRPKEQAAPATLINPSKIVEDALGLLESRISSSEVELSKKLDESLRVTMVSIDFYGVANNLLVNALDAIGSQPLPRKMSVALERQGEGVVLRVEDNGPGVPETARERIFEAFFTTKDEGRGMGLGLHLCKQFVEQAGGRVEVGTSALGGARFVVTLPTTS